jgi:hypothetical protein
MKKEITFNFGKVKIKRKIWYNYYGYPTISLHCKDIPLHILIWEFIHGKIPKGFQIHHKDLNVKNYSLYNLELVDVSTHRRLHAGWIKKYHNKWTHKPCTKCNKLLPLSQFFYIKTRKKESALCKQCHGGN